jgi:HEAT repeat protein
VPNRLSRAKSQPAFFPPLRLRSNSKSHSPWALGEIGGTEAIEELVLALDNPSADVGVYDIESLVKLKAAQALPELCGMLDDTESNHAGDITTVGAAARRAIAGIEAKQ